MQMAPDEEEAGRAAGEAAWGQEYGYHADEGPAEEGDAYPLEEGGGGREAG